MSTQFNHCQNLLSTRDSAEETQVYWTEKSSKTAVSSLIPCVVDTSVERLLMRAEWIIWEDILPGSLLSQSQGSWMEE